MISRPACIVDCVHIPFSRFPSPLLASILHPKRPPVKRSCGFVYGNLFRAPIAHEFAPPSMMQGTDMCCCSCSFSFNHLPFSVSWECFIPNTKTEPTIRRSVSLSGASSSFRILTPLTSYSKIVPKLSVRRWRLTYPYWKWKYKDFCSRKYDWSGKRQSTGKETVRICRRLFRYSRFGEESGNTWSSKKQNRPIPRAEIWI